MQNSLRAVGQPPERAHAELGTVWPAGIMLLTLTLTGCYSAENLEALMACAGGDPNVKPEAQIDSCTAYINSAKPGSRNLATALDNRGDAYAALGGDDRAIQDYDRALAIEPDL